MRAVGTLVVLTLGCQGRPDPGEQPLRAAQQVDFGDIAGLGPHRMEASTSRTDLREGFPPRQQDELTRVSWSGWDDFSLLRTRDGEPFARFEVAGGQGQALKPDGVMHDISDLEPLRLELRQAWDVWEPFLGPLRDHVVYTHQGQALVEGRLADQYSVSLAPSETALTTRTVPERIEGTLWLDEATGVRLMADVSTRWHRVGHEGEAQEAHLILVRTDFDQVQGGTHP